MGAGNTKIQYLTKDITQTEKEGEAGPYISYAYQDTDRYDEESKNDTAIGEIMKGMIKYPKKECLGYRKFINEDELEKKYTWFTFSEINKFSTTLSKNMVTHNLFDKKTFNDQEGNWKLVGIYARNCVEWIVTDIACQMNDVTSVTFYSTLGPDSFDYIFKQSEVSTVFVSPDSIPSLVEYHRKYNFKSLKNIVVFDLTIVIDKEKDIKEMKELGLNVLFITDLLNEESKEDIKLTAARPESVMTICYTSGTTSLPKGAMLTQRGFAVQRVFVEDSGINTNENDVILSFLPLAHTLDRINFVANLSRGCKFGFISGPNVKKYLMDDYIVLKPTILVVVPRILVAFHQNVLNEFNQLIGCKRNIAETGLAVKRANYLKNNEINHWYYDKVVFSKVKEKFGGRVRVILVGSAPLPRDVITDCKLLLCCPIVEGYGLTELHGASNASYIKDTRNLNVGGILRNLRLKLIDQKELNYHSKTTIDGKLSPTGEICFKGPTVFKGYFRDIENTKKMIDSEGWLHTGDVGRIDPINNGIAIIDRVKEIFKLSQGEYIAPVKLEGRFIKCPLVSQICVYGRSEMSYAIAIIPVNKANVADLLFENGIISEKNESIEPHLQNEVLLKAFKESFSKIGDENGFISIEKLSKFILTTEEFSINNGLLTPTMKLIRKKIELHFIDQINKIYTN